MASTAKEEEEEEVEVMDLQKKDGDEEFAVQKVIPSGPEEVSSSVDVDESIFLNKMRDNFRLPRKYKLATEEDARKYSMWSLQFIVLCSAISTKMLNPNYPIMVTPGAHPDSFSDTDPFDFNSATYFLPMCSLLGVAISSIFIGQLSDKVGRKNPLLVMGIISAIGNIVKYYCSNTFWAFSISNLVFGFFLGNLPVAMAYVGDVFVTKKEKEDQLGVLVGTFVMGNSGGGMIAILMNGSGLFAPLWVGTGLMCLSSILLAIYFIEPGKETLDENEEMELEELLSEENKKDNHNGNQDDDDTNKRPDTIDQIALWNVIAGALADNFGSTALFPMCLSPLALETFSLNFTTADPPEEPILTITGYQWLSVCVALMVIPSTMLTPWMFEKIGPSGTCVFGNTFTALLTIALLFIGNIDPPTTTSFAFFVAFMYGGFPFTVFSQLTTGPMLDVIAPVDKIGFVQGLNNSAMNFGMAIAPWLFGVLADATSTNTSIWTGIGISFGAAVINAPLMRRPEMGAPPKKVSDATRVLPGEDEEMTRLALAGEFIPPEVLSNINRKRGKEHKSFLIPAVKKYDVEENLDVLRDQALEVYKYRTELYDRVLTELSNPNRETSIEELCKMMNAAKSGDEELIQQRTADLGQWIGDYLQDNGYNPHVKSVMIKQMIMTAFPTISKDKEFTPDNVERYLLRLRRVMNMYLEHEEKKRYTLKKVLGTGYRPQFYS